MHICVYTEEKQRTERDPRVVYTIPGPQKRRKKVWKRWRIRYYRSRRQSPQEFWRRIEQWSRCVSWLMAKPTDNDFMNPVPIYFQALTTWSSSSSCSALWIIATEMNNVGKGSLTAVLTVFRFICCPYYRSQLTCVHTQWVINHSGTDTEGQRRAQ